MTDLFYVGVIIKIKLITMLNIISICFFKIKEKNGQIQRKIEDFL